MNATTFQDLSGHRLRRASFVNGRMDESNPELGSRTFTIISKRFSCSNLFHLLPLRYNWRSLSEKQTCSTHVVVCYSIYWTAITFIFIYVSCITYSAGNTFFLKRLKNNFDEMRLYGMVLSFAAIAWSYFVIHSLTKLIVFVSKMSYVHLTKPDR